MDKPMIGICPAFKCGLHKPLFWHNISKHYYCKECHKKFTDTYYDNKIEEIEGKI